MPIQIKTPDGSIAQFPDGMADADIEKVMAAHYPQPSMLDRAVASPVGRAIHDIGVNSLSGMANLAGKAADMTPFSLGLAGPLISQATQGVDQPYQGALARNRNTPGYAAARVGADKIQAQRGGSGFTDQMLSPILPTLAGTMGLFGSADTSNAMADAQTQGQDAYAAAHPLLSTGANILGGFAMGSPERPPTLPPQISVMAGQPVDAATAYVQRLMASSPNAPTPAGLRAAQTAAAGKPITSAEAIGKPAEVALGALARRDGATADALSGQMTTRAAAAPRRILDDYAAASGIHPDAARGDIEAFVQANQKAATPLYEGAYKANSNIASPMLDRILATPAGKQALTSARVKMQNDMSLMGTPDAELMDQAAEGGTPLPSNGAASGMKLRVYDYVKRSLDDQIDSAYRAGNKNEGNILRDLKGKLVGALDAADATAVAGPNSTKPEGGLYAQARAKAGEYLSAQKQYETAQSHILDDKFPVKDMADYVAKLGPADQQAYMGGVANRLFALQQAGKLKAAVFKAPIVQGKLAALMGPDKASAFIQNMATEQKMAEFARLRSPGAGSPTAEYTATMQDQDGASALALHGVQVAHDAARSGIVPALTNLALNKGKDMAAGYLTRGMAIPVRDAAGQMLMQPPGELATQLQGLAPLQNLQMLQLPKVTPRSALPYGLLLAPPSMANR